MTEKLLQQQARSDAESTGDRVSKEAGGSVPAGARLHARPVVCGDIPRWSHRQHRGIHSDGDSTRNVLYHELLRICFDRRDTSPDRVDNFDADSDRPLSRNSAEHCGTERGMSRSFFYFCHSVVNVVR